MAMALHYVDCLLCCLVCRKVRGEIERERKIVSILLNQNRTTCNTSETQQIVIYIYYTQSSFIHDDCRQDHHYERSGVGVACWTDA